MQCFSVLRHVGDAVHQSAGVGVRGLVDHVVHGPDFSHTPGVHHRHPVTGLGDHAHVVGDVHDGGTPLFANTLEQADDLCLDRDIQGGGGFIGHHQLRIGRQSQGDHHALAHATAELVREMVDALLGTRNARVFEQFNGPLTRLSVVERQVRRDGFDQLLADRIQGVERCQRVLKNRADVPPTDEAHVIVGQVVDAPTVEPDLAAGDAPGRLQQTDDGRASQGLARAGLAHDAQNFARGDVKAHAIEGAQGAASTGEFDHQVLHRQETQKRLLNSIGGSGRRASSRPAGSRSGQSGSGPHRGTR